MPYLPCWARESHMHYLPSPMLKNYHPSSSRRTIRIWNGQVIPKPLTVFPAVLNSKHHLMAIHQMIPRHRIWRYRIRSQWWIQHQNWVPGLSHLASNRAKRTFSLIAILLFQKAPRYHLCKHLVIQHMSLFRESRTKKVFIPIFLAFPKYPIPSLNAPRRSEYFPMLTNRHFTSKAPLGRNETSPSPTIRLPLPPLLRRYHLPVQVHWPRMQRMIRPRASCLCHHHGQFWESQQTCTTSFHTRTPTANTPIPTWAPRYK